MTIKFSRLEEVLKAKHYRALCVWMKGRTVGRGDEGDSIYDHDLLSWLKN